jgi:hypothetical protein
MDQKKKYITKTDLYAERLITELILMGKMYIRPVASVQLACRLTVQTVPHVKVGRRFKFKWKQNVWYTGTVMCVDKKNKKNGWWNVQWDDGIKQRVLLSKTNISRWCLI